MRRYAAVFAVLGLCGSARADILVPGANGSDGPFNPTGGVTVDLSLAPTGSWDSNSPTPGNGVYDPTQWAVVFHYTSVTIPAGATLSFQNHVSRAPVVWLVSGNVEIAGSVLVAYDALGDAGPGGFRGGLKDPGTGANGGGGFGPGGGMKYWTYAAYGATPETDDCGQAYGNARIIPLIGGSGGGQAPGYPYGSGKSIGAGAILIAATGTIHIGGTIVARGSYDRASGGAVRLVAESVTGSGLVDAAGTLTTNPGRIRVEANTIDPGLQMNPVGSGGRPGGTATLWPSDTMPSTRIVSVGGEPMPSDPHAQFNAAADVFPDPLASVIPVVIETKNVPTTATVNLRFMPIYGDAQMIKATFTSGDANTAFWTANISPPAGTSALQVRVEAP